jgi:hypothetical protein
MLQYASVAHGLRSVYVRHERHVWIYAYNVYITTMSVRHLECDRNLFCGPTGQYEDEAKGKIAA